MLLVTVRRLTVEASVIGVVGLATACGSSQAAGTIYTPREVQAAFHAALGFPVYKAPMSQRPGEVVVFYTQAATL